MKHQQDLVKEVIAETTGNLVVIDGSLLAFRASAAGEVRTISVKHRKTGKVEDFKNRTAFKEYLSMANSYSKEELKAVVTDYEITDVITPQPVATSLHIVKEIIKHICGLCDANSYKIYIDADGDTLRDSIATVSKYKGNRSGKIKPANLQDVKDYLVLYCDAEVVDTIEVDDLLNMYMYEGHRITRGGGSRKIIAATFDKDAYSHDGWIFDFRKDSGGTPLMKTPVLVDGVGELTINAKNEVKGCGRKHLMFQWIYGDVSDNYRANKLAKVRFGEKSAYNLLNPLETDKELITGVANQFLKWYPSPIKYTTWDGKEVTKDWVEIAQEYFSLCHMHRWPDDVVDVESVFVKMGIEVNVGRNL